MSEGVAGDGGDPVAALLRTAVWMPIPGSKIAKALAPMRRRQTQLPPPTVTHRGTIAIAGFSFGLTCWRLSNGHEHIDPRSWRAYMATLNGGMGARSYSRTQIEDAVRRLMEGQGHE